jgi:hypothetical protein
MDIITNFEKIIKNTKTEEIVLEDIEGDILKILKRLDLRKLFVFLLTHPISYM